MSLLIVNTIYLFSALLYAKVVPKNRVYAQYIVYQLYNQKNNIIMYYAQSFSKSKGYFHFEKVYKTGKLPVLGNLPGMQEQSVPHYSP